MSAQRASLTRTQLFVVLDQDTEEESQGDSKTDSLGNGSSKHLHDGHGDPRNDRTYQEDLSDDFDIDESFLESQVLEDFFSPRGTDETAIPRFYEDVPRTQSMMNGVQKGIESLSHDEDGFCRLRFGIELMSSRSIISRSLHDLEEQKANLAAVAAGSDSQTREVEEIDDSSIILINQRNLVKLGCFSGDWCVIKVSGKQELGDARKTGHATDASGKGKGKERLVRILVDDSVPVGSNQGDHRIETQGNSSSPLVAISPILYQNLFRIASFDPLEDINSSFISLKPVDSYANTKFSDTASKSANMLSLPLKIPFAESLTISRIPSSFSMDRKYQSLFLEGLKQYFEDRRRIVKKGDVIAIGLDEDGVKFVKAAGTEDEDEEKNSEDVTDGNKDELENVIWDLPTASRSKSKTMSQVVYFSITSLTPELLSPESHQDHDERIASGHSDEIYALLREKARKGGLGSVVDSRITKLVQTGISNRRVLIEPISDFLGIRRASTPLFPFSGEDSRLVGKDSTFDRLLKLLKAVLRKDSKDFGLHLSVVLKGARGSGKATLIKWLAEKAGVHLIEVSCSQAQCKAFSPG